MTDEPTRRSPASRILGAGARAGERVAAITGVDQAVEDAIEESLVRALRSPAVERAIVRLIEQNAVQDAIGRAVAQDELADAIVKALDSEAADRVWAELLASNKAQMLVERIAEAPEVRAAITQQGAGLITDVGRRLTVLTEALDDALEKLIRRRRHEAETDEVGLLTRALAAGIDFALLSALYSLVSGLLASVIPVAFGLDRGENLPLWAIGVLAAIGFVTGGAIIVGFWSLVGQTPGMRFLSIRLDVDGSREVGLGHAVRRLFGVPLALAPLGLGFLVIVVSPTRRGWHDHLAGTRVVYDRTKDVAPHSQRTLQ